MTRKGKTNMGKRKKREIQRTRQRKNTQWKNKERNMKKRCKKSKH